MKRLLFIPTATRLAACAATAMAVTLPHSAEAQFVRGFGTSSDVTLRIYVPKGRLQINTWARDSIHIQGSVGEQARFFGGGSRTHLKFGVEPAKSTDRDLPSADWTVTLPRAARVWLKTVDSDIALSGSTGEVELYAVTGRIVVNNVSGITSVESIDASVQINRASGDVRVRGSRGDLNLNDITGTLSASTVSGNVALLGVAATGRVETIGGTITVRDVALTGHALDLQSHAGTIALFVNPSACPLLNVSSRTNTVDGGGFTGEANFGTLTARSFRGRITVRGAR